MKNTETILYKLIAAGLGQCDNIFLSSSVDWEIILKMSSRQGVSAICLDGLQLLDKENNCLASIPKMLKMQWIASVMQQEQVYKAQWNAAKGLAELYEKYDVDIFVMKGFSLSRLYPRSEHRQCTDMDCYLKDKYEDGNRIAKENGLTVDCSYYKHSKILLKGLTVKNHQYLLPIKGSSKAKRFEHELRSCIDDGVNEYIGKSRLIATSPFFDAIYVLAHAQEHFLNEGIILRHICDWAMVLKTYATKVDWEEWKMVCNEYGMLSFGYAMSRLAKKVCGVKIPFDCPVNNAADRRLLEDTLYRKVSVNGKRSNMQVRINLVKNMFSNSWKYRLFSDTNFLMFCGRRVWGYLFDKDLD